MKPHASPADSHHAQAMEPEDSQAKQILDQLGHHDKGLPVDAIRAATANRAAMVPLILRALDQPAAASRSMQDALFIAFHLLGEWREKSAYRPLAAFLRQPAADIEPIIGGATTETTHRVMACLFDGDPNPLYEVIREPKADEFIRARMCAVLAMVTLRGELPREETMRFLQSCYGSLQPQDECYVWDGWQSAIALLGLGELKPLVKQAFERGFISPGWLQFTDFEQDLQGVLDGEPDQLRGPTDEFELFGDTIEELSGWAAFAPKKREKPNKLDSIWRPNPAPAVPFKEVGRNERCPCGSGKKFKKCCLDKFRPEQKPAPVLPSMDEWPLDDEFDLAELEDLIGDYDPFEDPDPEQWLMLDEQERIDVVLEYHRNADISLPNEKLHAIFHVVAENQIADDELPVRCKLQQLMSEGLDRHDAIHAIGSVLYGQIFDLLREADKDDQRGKLASGWDPNEAYFAELERLTARSWRRST